MQEWKEQDNADSGKLEISEQKWNVVQNRRCKIIHLGENTLKYNSKRGRALESCNAKKDLKVMDSRQ